MGWVYIENGYSVIEEPKRRRGLSYNRWQEQQGIENKSLHRDVLRQSIDKALAQKPTDFEALLKLLQVDNIEVDKRSKSWRLKAADRKQFTRLGSLGEGYSKAELKIALTSAKAPKAKEKINLLIDIQQKLVEGKGGGDGSQLVRPLGAEGEQGPVAQVDPVEEAQGDDTFFPHGVISLHSPSRSIS